jgi:hypothetical protein
LWAHVSLKSFPTRIYAPLAGVVKINDNTELARRLTFRLATATNGTTTKPPCTEVRAAPRNSSPARSATSHLLKVDLMKKLHVGILAVVTVCLGCAVASAQVVLYTTQQDFAPATSASGTTITVGPPGVTGDTDGSTINGLGNTSNPGGVGAAGALFLQANTLGYEQVNLGDEAANAPFLAALKNNNKLSLDYTLPQTLTTGANGYFQISLVFNWTGGYQGFNNNAFFNGANLTAGSHTVTFDYSSLQAGLPSTQPSYFQLFLIVNSGGSLTPTAPVQLYVDNIAVVPEPASATLLGLGIPILVFFVRRARRL